MLNSRRSAVDHGAEGFETGSLGLAVHQKRQRQAAAEEWNVPQVEPPQPAIIDIKVTTEMVQDAQSGDSASERLDDAKTKRFSEFGP